MEQLRHDRGRLDGDRHRPHDGRRCDRSDERARDVDERSQFGHQLHGLHRHRKHHRFERPKLAAAAAGAPACPPPEESSVAAVRRASAARTLSEERPTGPSPRGWLDLRTFCTANIFCSTIVQSVLTHELGHSLGLGHSEESNPADTIVSPHDVCPGDEDDAIMRWTVQNRTTLGTDDQDAIRWIYGDGGNHCTNVPLTINSVTASPTLPKPTGTPITWTANTTGGTAPLRSASTGTAPRPAGSWSGTTPRATPTAGRRGPTEGGSTTSRSG